MADIEFSAAQLRPGDLYAHLLRTGSARVDGYLISTDETLFGPDLWLTDPYGSDHYAGELTLESCAGTLLRIANSDPNGTEKDPW